MRLLLTSLMLTAAAHGQVLEDFEHGNPALYPVVSGGADSLNITGAASHDGSLGVEFGSAGPLPWYLRSDIPTAPGNTYLWYVRIRAGVVPAGGSSWVGVGADSSGAWSAVFSPYTASIRLQDNTGYGYVDAASTLHPFATDTWYQMRLTWESNGDMTLDLFDESGTTLVVSTGTVATGFTRPGGLALRGFTIMPAASHDLDTIREPGMAGIGTNYCAANPNTTGNTGSMSANGSASVADNDLTLVASDLPNNATTFFITSMMQGFVMNPNGSDGNLCLGGSIGRYVGPGQVQNTGGTGAASLDVDLTMHPQPMGFVSVGAGETWSFQAWHRDSNMGTPTSNFTDGLEITFN